MTKIFFKLLIIFSLVSLPLVSVWATNGPSNHYGLDTAAGGTSLKSPGSSASGALAEVAGTMVGAILSFLGIIFLVLMIVGGIMWMTGGGNEAKVKTAKNLIVAAIIGLIIVLSAYAITTFVAANLT